MDYDPKNQPAWPLGCGAAFLALLLIVNILGLGGIVFAAGGLPVWLQRGGPMLLALLVPAAMLAGAALTRRRNPYGARVLLWACGLTVIACTLFTVLANLIDRLTLR